MPPGRLLLLSCLLPAALSAQTANVTVDAGAAVRTVDERVFGLNAVMWDGHTGTDQTIALLAAAGVRTIRAPGGSLSDEYHWRTNRTRANSWSWAAGFDAFTRLITGLEAQAYVTVNYGSGTPQEAAAWVAYANAAVAGSAPVDLGIDAKGSDWLTASSWAALRASTPLAQDDGMNFLRLGRSAPIGIRHWEIGNENYGAGWEYDEQGLPHDPYTYAVRAKDYITRMKAVDPTIKIGVVAVPSETDYANGYTAHPATNPRTGAVRYGWTPVMLATLKSLGVTPDALIYHRYEQAPAADRPGDPEGDAKLLQSAATWSNDAAVLRQMLVDYLGATEAAKVELVVTENNSVYAKPGKQTTSLVNALFYADSLGQLLQTEFNALLWWDLRNGQETGNNNSASLYGWRNYGDYGILSSPNAATGTTGHYEPYPAYYAIKQAANFARGGDTIVRATSSHPRLAVYAAQRTAGDLSLLVINKDPFDAIAADIALTGFAPLPVAAVRTYGKPQDDAARTGSGPTDIAAADRSVSDRTFSATFPAYSITVVTLAPVAPARLATTVYAQPAARAVAAGQGATFAAALASGGSATWQWQRNGADLPGATGASLGLVNVQPADAGLYRAVATGAGAGEPVILGLGASAKVTGAGTEVGTNIVHQNGNIYDQVLLEGTAAAITADAGQVVRLSYIDLDDDIVQVEFSGAGTLSIVLDSPTGPAPPANYNQAVNYMKGHAGIVVTGADETTNLSVFSVGTITAVNQALFKPGVVYDGFADLAYVAIASPTGRFGGLRTANASYYAARGLTGVYAPGVRFEGPVLVGDIRAFDDAMPALVLGAAADVRVTGGDLTQANNRAIAVSGVEQLQFTAGSSSHGTIFPAQANRARLERNGTDVTAQLAAGP